MEVVYEDNHLIVVNKAAGEIVHQKKLLRMNLKL